MSDLEKVAKALVDSKKGILAADESLPTIEKRFDAIQIESTEEARRAYREILFTTPGMEKYISGVILFEESLKHITKEGVFFPKLLEEKGIIPGVKVDKGKIDFPNFPGEKLTQGLDGLGERLEEYQKLGAKFTKWRAVINISDHLPTQTAIETASHLMAIFAAISQNKGFVPIVEPEVLMDGRHEIERCESVTRAVLTNLFVALQDYKVNLKATLLKPNMIISGKDSVEKANPEQIAELTLSVLRRTVTKSLPGAVFLSGGQSPKEATINLNEINKAGKDAPWELSFSFGRALQQDVLEAWEGKLDNKEKAQEAFLKRAKLVSLARQGKYNKS